MLVHCAQSLLPVAGPPVRDGAVAVLGGRIVRCGPRSEVVAFAAGASVQELGSVALLPGLVNAHAHLELSWLAADPPPGGEWVAWVRGLLARREGENAERSQRAAERAVLAVAARGTVAVGDVGNHGWPAAVLARSDLHGVCFREIYGWDPATERRIEEEEARLAAVVADDDVRNAKDRLRVVLTPHAPHTTSPSLLRALARRSALAGDPLSIHVAESAAESALLRDGSGPAAELLRQRGIWDGSWSPAGCTPVEYLDRLGVLTPRTLAVHCVHLEQDDLATLATRGVTVVTCPRSNRRLGVGTAPVGRLVAAGIPVSLGTDSLASAPDLDLFAEMAALRTEHPGISPAQVLRIATLNGAKALGLADRLGSIEVGKLARLVVVPLESPADDPLEVVSSNPRTVLPLDRAPWEPAS